MPVISQAKRHKILLLYEGGMTQRKIAEKVEVSLNGVQGVVKRFNGGFGTKNKPRPNLHRKLLTERTERKLLVTSKRNPKLTARQLQSECALKNMSVDTVKRSLRKNGQMGLVAIKKPILTTMHKRKRPDWCRRKSAWALMTGVE